MKLNKWLILVLPDSREYNSKISVVVILKMLENSRKSRTGVRFFVAKWPRHTVLLESIVNIGSFVRNVKVYWYHLNPGTIFFTIFSIEIKSIYLISSGTVTVTDD